MQNFIILLFMIYSGQSIAENTLTHLGLLKPGDIIEFQADTYLYGFSQASLDRARASCVYDKIGRHDEPLTRFHVCIPQFKENKGAKYKVVKIKNNGSVDTQNQGAGTQQELAIQLEPIGKKNPYDQIFFAMTHDKYYTPTSDRLFLKKAVNRNRNENCHLLLQETNSFYLINKFKKNLNDELFALTKQEVSLYELSSCESRLNQAQTLLRSTQSAEGLLLKIQTFINTIGTQDEPKPEVVNQ